MKEKEIILDQKTSHFALWDKGENIGVSIVEMKPAAVASLFAEMTLSIDEPMRRAAKIIAAAIIASATEDQILEIEALSEEIEVVHRDTLIND